MTFVRELNNAKELVYVPYEMERKFLVADEKILDGLEGTEYKQAYISTTGQAVVRVRIAGDSGYITLKSNSDGIKRLEYEYEIPKHHAVEMIENLCDGSVVEKIRYSVRYEGHEWTIDKFVKDNLGLVVAEIELLREDETFLLPYWLGKEVTGQDEYYNVSLAKNPYLKWST